MEEQLIKFKTSKLAKEKGFKHNSKCYGGDGKILKNIENHTNNMMQRFRYEAPTQSLLQKWLRDIHKIHVNPVPYRESYDKVITGYYMGEILNSKGEVLYHGDDNYATYKEALEKGLQEALKLI